MRAVTAEDLVGLVDIGDPSWAFDSAGLSLSPDKRFVVFSTRRAIAASNSYCQAIVVVTLDGSGPPKVIDTSSELVLEDFDNRGILQRGDYPLIVRPKWSPDGQWIAYLKQVDGRTLLWRAKVDGSGARAIAGTAGIASRFSWLGNNMLVVTRPSGLAAAKAAIDKEARDGFRFDERFAPNLSDQPFPRTPTGKDYLVVDAVTGAERGATPSERALVDPDRPPNALLTAVGSSGDSAWTALNHPDRFLSDGSLFVRFAAAATQSCGASLCDKIVGLWWSDRHGLIFARREGWTGNRTGFYRWRKGEAAPTRLFATDDLILDCQLAHEILVCGHERSLKPRAIVALDIASGAMRTIYDPNPGFSRLSLGKVEHLHWRAENGAQVYGDLVYPVGFTAGERYPVIVTNYTSRGFLRGATGDEYPIQLFANHGFAVLSLQPPSVMFNNLAGIDRQRAWALEYKDWTYRKVVQSAVAGGLDLLKRKGIIDPGRAGITGLSDGTSTVQYAVLNSSLFKAASISSCCVDAHSLLADSGLNTGDAFRSFGLPALDDPNQQAWSEMSLTLSASKVEAAILMQSASDEFRLALSSYTALRARHRPVEMYIFPKEGHVKLQPAHRLAAYRRNLAWFEFWLMNKEDASLATPDDFARWRRLREDYDRHQQAERAGRTALSRPSG